MNDLYKTLGISKQAVHRYTQRTSMFEQKLEFLLKEAGDLRAVHLGCGVEKMYYSLQPDFLGRDRFIELFIDLGLGLKSDIIIVKRLRLQRFITRILSRV